MTATVCDLSDWLDGSGDGVHWALDPPSDLNVNLVRLEPGHSIGAHVNRVADVVFVIIEGSGTMCSDGVEHRIGPRAVIHVPKGAHRRIQADDDGLAYLTVHRRRSLDITPPHNGRVDE